MAIGGFNGSDPAPTLAQFKAYVPRARSTTSSVAVASAARVASGSSSAIATWVAASFTTRTVNGVTLYDLTAPTTTATGA